MRADDEINKVLEDYERYLTTCKKIKEDKKRKIIRLKFCSTTYGRHPNLEAVKALAEKGFVHRNGKSGMGYYADNVK